MSPLYDYGDRWIEVKARGLTADKAEQLAIARWQADRDTEIVQ